VDSAVVAAAEQNEVSDCRFAALRPVADVMGIDEAAVLAAGEAASTVAATQRTAKRRRDRPGLAAVAHNGGVAGEPARRLSRERTPVVELADAFAVLRQDIPVRMDDDLIALTARPLPTVEPE
jgi:hypothetical protein